MQGLKEIEKKGNGFKVETLLNWELICQQEQGRWMNECRQRSIGWSFINRRLDKYVEIRLETMGGGCRGEEGVCV